MPAIKTLRVAAITTFAIFATAACGEDLFTRRTSHQPAPHAAAAGGLHVWDGSPQLGENKKRVAAAVRARKGDAAKVALLMAIGMQETNNFSAHERDASKDNTPAANYSAFNVNKAFLAQVGWKEGQGRNLNDDGALEDAVGWVIKGLDKMGEDGFLCFHRGGETSYRDRCSYGAKEYIAAIRSAQAYLLAHPDCITNNKRVAGNVPHV